MRFLGVGDYNSLADMYLHLLRSGHEVRVYVGETEAHDIYAGLLERINDWRAELAWIRAAGADGIILFEGAAMGEIADALRRDGYFVIGGCAWTDRLETDRAYGQQVMRDIGLQTAPTFEFHDYDAGIAFVRAQPGRYVYKISDGVAASTRNYVGALDSGADIIAMLAFEKKRVTDAPRFVLMQHVRGVEVGIGAYFNGREFLQPACIDWEHKRFFPGDLGELTGEMGTVVSYRGAQALFAATLARLAPGLQAGGHCGYININLIVNEQGIWPLEFTCRFGYPGFAICAALHTHGWAEIFHAMVHGGTTFSTEAGFAVGVVLTVPPFPHEYGYAELSKGCAIFIDDSADDQDLANLHLGEVALIDGQLVTAGSLGYAMVATGVGTDVAAAQAAAYARVALVAVPNLRYRNDIGDKLVSAELARLNAWGYAVSNAES